MTSPTQPTPTRPTPAGPAVPGPGPVGAPSPTLAGRLRRRWPWIAAGTAAAVLVSGGAVYAGTHKTVEVDLAGDSADVSTFAGSVQGVLDQEHITLGPHDVVTPAAGSKLTDGQQIVVRYGHQVTVDVDGAKSTVWTTALDANEALAALSRRGEDVSLVANRSEAGGRPALGIQLEASGPVAVVADGRTHVVADASAGTDAVLRSLGITVGTMDRLSVERTDGDPALRLVVQRVEQKTVRTTRSIGFDTVRRTDASRYADLGSVVRREGHQGVYTTTYSVVTVDGKVESRTVVGKGVTRKPVAEVVVRGTKQRPAASTAGTTSTSSSSSSSSSSKSSTSSSSGSAPTSGVWAALAKCESGGNPKAVNPAGYYGLYQFTVGTWHAMGGSGLPTDASAAEQTARAKALQARSGWGQWPACAAKLGLL